MTEIRQLNPKFSLKVDEIITLRIPTVDEAESLFCLVDQNRAHLRQFLGWVDMSREVADTRKFIEDNLPHWLQLDSLHLSIWKKDKLVGAVGLHEIDFQNHSAYMGYWLDQAEEKQGIMTKSVQTLIAFCFNVLKLHRVQMLCAITNYRSQKIPERLGFRKEGTLKEAIYHYNEYFDAYLYGLIAP